MPRTTCAPNDVQKKGTKEKNVRKGTMTSHLQNIQQMHVDDDATLFVRPSGSVPIHLKGESVLCTVEDPRGHSDLSSLSW